MPDPAPSSSRLEDLRMRWQLDPASRVYLQLAEEYRKLDRHPEAIEVLKRGLQQRPNDLSGQVALGRCHLEMEELAPAVQLLEGVIDRDPAHMVGNKLLLEAYLKSGEAARAGERLELYKLLNPADPDIETLEAGLRRLRSAAPGIPEPDGVTTAEIPIVPRGKEREPPAPPARDPAFETSPAFVLPDLTRAVEEEPPAVEEPPLIDEALIGGDSSSTETTLDEIPFAGDDETPPYEEPAFELVPDEPAATPVELPAAGVPAARVAVARVVAAAEPARVMALAAGELFYLGPPPPPPRFEELWGWPVPPPVMAAPPAIEAPLEEPEIEEPEIEELAIEEPEIEEPFVEEPFVEEPFVEEPFVEEPVAEELAVEEMVVEEAPAAEEVVAAPEPVAPPPVAPPPEPKAEEPQEAEEPVTATLGALYLRQGHKSEAEKIFRQVLRRDPRNAAALAGLARIRGETGLTAQALLASAGERIPVGLTAKKIRLLESYMNHLRNAGESHVH